MSFRVLCDQARMPLPAHSLTHQNQPRVYPSHTPVSFLPLHSSTWHSLCLEFFLSRWKPHFWQAAFRLSWADDDLSMAVSLGLLPSSRHTCNYLGETAGVCWWAGGPREEQEGVCSQMDTRICSRLIFPLSRNDIPSRIKWPDKTFSAPFLRVTKRFEWCQRQEHFVRRIICFANIRKIIIILIDRIEWKEHARDFDLLQKSECLLCIMVSFNFYNLWVKAQRGIGICPSSHGWLAMDSQAETTDWIQILLALKPWFFTVTSCFQTPRVMSVACIEFGAASLEQRLFIMNSIWLIQRSFSKTQLPKCSPRDWIY